MKKTEYYEFEGVSAAPLPGNIEKREMPFSGQEYARRLAATKNAMMRRGVDVLLVTDPANICYLCGYAAPSGYVAQGLLLHSRDNEPEFYLRRQDAPAAMYMTPIPNDRIHGYPESFIGDPELSGFDYIFDAIKEHSDVTRIGLEYGSLAAISLETIRKRFVDFEYLDFSGQIELIRLIKSPDEINYMRKAGRITESVALRLPEWFRAGRRECEAAADIQAALLKGLPGIPGEQTNDLVLPGGKQSGTPHVTWRDKDIELGCHYNPEFAGCVQRYHAPIMRTVSIGKPSSKLDRMYGYMVEGCNEALAAVRPGIACADVARKYCHVLGKGGYWKDSRCGYPIGINWLETSCSLRVDDLTELKPNMAFHLMLGVWLEEDFGAVISEAFVVSDSGHEVLSAVPRAIVVA
ncbi:MAG: Xaa-Pro peptidase family protein [Pseudomonadota bacterium]